MQIQKYLVYRIIVLTLLAQAMVGCIIVKEDSGESKEPNVAISTQPAIAMSDEIVRSSVGDMVALLPEEWFFMDVKNKVPSNVFAVAVNPQYTLSLVFFCYP